jgi:hypothetical protein
MHAHALEEKDSWEEAPRSRPEFERTRERRPEECRSKREAVQQLTAAHSCGTIGPGRGSPGVIHAPGESQRPGSLTPPEGSASGG